LGIGSTQGFSSILVPGCGEANFDGLEQNPFRTKAQRREHEVKALLEKIPSELITMNTRDIVNVDLDRLETKLQEKKEIKVSITQVKEKRSRSSVDTTKIRKLQKEQEKQQLMKAAKIEELKAKRREKKKATEVEDEFNVFDRFKKKSKK
jgi:U3 small nucleolar RNA-associated protein 7